MATVVVVDIEDTHQEPEGPLTPVALFDEERQRRAGRVKARPRRRTSQPPAPASEDDGYGWTRDLAGTANLPDEDAEPSADELLARYESPPPATASSADTEKPSAAGVPPAADEILLAISTHHDRAEPPGPTQAPRGSADLRPAAPRTRRRASASGRAAPLPGRTQLRTAVSARWRRWLSAISRASLRSASRVRVLAAVGLGCAALLALAVGLRALPSAPPRTPPATQADHAHAQLIGTGTLALLTGELHGSTSPLGWKLPAVAATKAPARHNVRPARHRVKSGRPRTRRPAHRTHTTSASTLSRSQGNSTVAQRTPASQGSSTPAQSSSTEPVSHAPSQTQSSQKTSGNTSGADHGTAGATDSAGCRGAGVMAPTNCGKPSL